MSKRRRTFYLNDKIFGELKCTSKKLDISQGKIVERALRRELERIKNKKSSLE